MAPRIVREGLSLQQLQEIEKKLLWTDERKLPDELHRFTRYQAGQLATYFLFKFYKLSLTVRSESDDGKLFYTILTNLSKYAQEAKFKEGFKDPFLQQQLSSDSRFKDYVAIMHKYEAYKKAEIDNKRIPLVFVNYLLEGLDQRELPIQSVPTRVDTLAKIDEITLNTFIQSLKFPIPERTSREDKIRLLVGIIQKTFTMEKEKAEDVLRALLYAYATISSDDKKLFAQWFKEVDKKNLAIAIETVAKSRSTTSSYQIVRDNFTLWKKDYYERLAKAQEAEAALKAYPERIRYQDMQKFLEDFEKNPSGDGLLQLSMKYEYAKLFIKIKGSTTDKKELERFASAKKDVDALEKWLAKLNLKIGGLGEITDKDAKTLAQLTGLKNAMRTVEDLYLNAKASDPALVIYLNQNSSNDMLYGILKKHLLNVDSKMAKIFTGIKSTASNFEEKINERILMHLTVDIIQKGQNIWMSEYYPSTTIPPEQVANLPLELRLRVNAAKLDPLPAAMFYNYVETVRKMGLGSEQEKKAIVETVTKLYALNPVLAVKYFTAMKHLAELCRDNPDSYIRALTLIAAQVDSRTRPAFDKTSPLQLVQFRSMISNIDAAFDGILNIKESSLSQYDRYDTLDRNITIDQYPPHAIRQKPPPWMYLLKPPETFGTGFYPPYPLPANLVVAPYLAPFTSGGVSNLYPYSGSLNMPRLTLSQVAGQTELVGGTIGSYLHQTHPVLSLSEDLPRTYISPLSITKLLNQLNQAFLPSQRPEYGREIIGGGGGFGIVGRKTTEWELAGGGLASLLTSTGGWAIGGSGTESGSVFVGTAAVAVPIDSVPIVGPNKMPGKKGPQEVGISSAVGGFEQLDDETRKYLFEAISQQWDPKNPSEIVVAVNRESVITDEGKRKGWMTARYFYVDKQGTIYEIKGGTNDFVKMLNFLAIYGDKPNMQPFTYAGNIEPGIERGGGAVAFDVSKASLLFHAQAVPFEPGKKQNSVELPDPITGETRTYTWETELPPPLLLEWTPAGGGTVQKEGDKARIIEASLPGKILRAYPETGGKAEREYIIQGVTFTVREVEGKNAWELNIGGDYAQATTKTSQQLQVPEGVPVFGGETLDIKGEDKRKGGRAGFLFKTQETKVNGITNFGLGASYESGVTRLSELALLQQEEESRRFVESLHRITLTVYGTQEVADKEFLGMLAHIVPEFTSAEGNYEFNDVLFRTIGFFRGLGSVAKIDVTRGSNLDLLLLDYQENVLGKLGDNPQGAEQLIDEFTMRNASKIRELFNNYYLGLQINDDLSVEVNVISRERSGPDYLDQEWDTVNARFLYTFGDEFVRAFASVPVWTNVESSGRQTIGVTGAGGGFNLLDKFWMQRLALDAGVLLAREETTEQLGSQELPTGKWGGIGGFVQGAAVLYSDILEDHKVYRKLEKDFMEYSSVLNKKPSEKIVFSNLPSEVRSYMCDWIQHAQTERKTTIITPEVLQKIRSGEDVLLNSHAIDELQTALWHWFDDEKFGLQQKFDGHVRSYLASGGYFFSDKIYWDAAAFFEYVDRFKAYVISSKRDEYQLFAGADLNITPKLILGTVGGVTLSGEKEVGASISLRYKTSIGEFGGLVYGRSRTPPAYSWPALLPYLAEGTPEFGIVFFYSIGWGGGAGLQTISPGPYEVPPGGGYR